MKGGYDKAMADLELAPASSDVETAEPTEDIEPKRDPGAVVTELRAKLDELEASL